MPIPISNYEGLKIQSYVGQCEGDSFVFKTVSGTLTCPSFALAKRVGMWDDDNPSKNTEIIELRVREHGPLIVRLWFETLWYEDVPHDTISIMFKSSLPNGWSLT